MLRLIIENRWVWAAIGLGLIVIYIVVFFYGQWIFHQYGFEFGKGGAPKAGEFGDTYGALTAFFTGAGFVGAGIAIFSQLQKQSVDEERARYATTMRTVNEMDGYYNNDRMRKLRCVASSFFLNAVVNDASENRELRQEVAKHLEKYPIRRVETEIEEFAIRDVLNYLETVAHFTNHDAVDDDLVLSVFHSRLKMYAEYANKYFPPLRDSWAQHSLVWIELKTAYEDRITQWLNEENKEHKVPTNDDQEMYTETSLLESLMREHVRCHARL
jgi:hypothetical protein